MFYWSSFAKRERDPSGEGILTDRHSGQSIHGPQTNVSHAAPSGSKFESGQLWSPKEIKASDNLNCSDAGLSEITQFFKAAFYNVDETGLRESFQAHPKRSTPTGKHAENPKQTIKWRRATLSI